MKTTMKTVMVAGIALTLSACILDNDNDGADTYGPYELNENIESAVFDTSAYPKVEGSEDHTGFYVIGERGKGSFYENGKREINGTYGYGYSSLVVIAEEGLTKTAEPGPAQALTVHYLCSEMSDEMIGEGEFMEPREPVTYYLQEDGTYLSKDYDGEQDSNGECVEGTDCESYSSVLTLGTDFASGSIATKETETNSDGAWEKETINASLVKVAELDGEESIPAIVSASMVATGNIDGSPFAAVHTPNCFNVESAAWIDKVDDGEENYTVKGSSNVFDAMFLNPLLIGPVPPGYVVLASYEEQASNEEESDGDSVLLYFPIIENDPLVVEEPTIDVFAAGSGVLAIQAGGDGGENFPGELWLNVDLDPSTIVLSGFGLFD